MAKHEFDKDAIWDKISKDERLPEPKSKRSNLFIYLTVLLLFMGILLTYYTINSNVEIKQEAKNTSKIPSSSTVSEVESTTPLQESTTFNDQKNEIKQSTIQQSSTSLNKNATSPVFAEKPTNLEINEPFKYDESRNSKVTNQQLNLSVITATTPFSSQSKSDFNDYEIEEKEISKYETSTTQLEVVDEYSDDNEATQLWKESVSDVSFLSLNQIALFTDETMIHLKPLELNRTQDERLNPPNKSNNIPFYIALQGGVAKPFYSLTSENGNPLYELQNSNFIIGGHLQTSLGYSYKNWEFESGLSFEHYKSSIEKEVSTIDYVVNSITERIEKIQTTNNYLL